MRTPSYSHSQGLWVLWTVLPAALVAIAMTLATADPAQQQAMIPLFIVLPVLVVALLGRLRVQLDDHMLEWQFGYLGWPRWRLALADIVSIETTRTGWIDGWGIHYGRAGWLYNAAGFGAVRIQTRQGRVIRLGTDEPDRLRSFIQARLPRQP